MRAVRSNHSHDAVPPKRVEYLSRPLAMGQNPGYFSVNIPIQPLKQVLKWVVDSPTKMGSQNGFEPWPFNRVGPLRESFMGDTGFTGVSIQLSCRQETGQVQDFSQKMELEETKTGSTFLPGARPPIRTAIRAAASKAENECSGTQRSGRLSGGGGSFR